MKLKNIILFNVLTGWFERVVSIGQKIILTPFILYHLGKEPYGIWVTIGQGASLMMLLDLGIANTIARFVSKYEALNERGKISEVVSAGIFIFLIGSILVLLSAGVLFPFVPPLFRISSANRHIAQWVFLITAMGIAFTFPCRAGPGLLQAKNKYSTISLINATRTVLVFFMILILFSIGKDSVLVLSIIFSGTGVISVLVMLFQGWLLYRFRFLNYSKISTNIVKEMFSLGSSAVVFTFAGTIQMRLQIMLVGILLGAINAPLFSIPAMIIYMMGAFTNRLGSTFTPLASSMHAVGESEKLRTLNLLGVRYGLLLSIPISVYLVLFSGDMLTLWLSRSGMVEADIMRMSIILMIMAIPYSIASAQKASSTILVATGKHWAVSVSAISVALFGLGTSAFLCVKPSVGILGAAIGFAITDFLLGCIVYPVLICKHIEMSFFSYIACAYSRPLLTGILLLVIGRLIKFIFPGPSIAFFALRTGLYGIATLILSYIIILIPEHKEFIIRLLKISFKANSFAKKYQNYVQ
ncbi:MAG: hypothetical protein ACMUJM_00095 [bacterium]